MISKDNIDNNGCKHIMYFYITACMLSFMYCIITGTYNGDFINKDIYLNIETLLIVLLCTILPYIYIYKVYKNTKNEEEYIAKWKINNLRNITWILIILRILISLTGYGRMGSDSVSMSYDVLSILRAVVFKIGITPILTIYLLSTKSKKNTICTSLLYLIQSACYHSLSGFVYISFIIYIKYHDKIILFIKRHFIITLIIIIIIPTFVDTAYNIRSELRNGTTMSETSKTDIIFGKLCGRLSSYSNGAYIIEKSVKIYNDSKDIPSSFYFIETLHYWGYRPEFKSIGNYINMEIKNVNNENLSVMPGIVGILVISFIISPNICLINLILIIIYIHLIFWCVRKMKFRYSSEIAFLLTIGFATSGDITELSNSFYILVLTFIFLNCTNKISILPKRKK